MVSLIRLAITKDIMDNHLIRFNELNQLAVWAEANLPELERKKIALYIVNRIKEIVDAE